MLPGKGAMHEEKTAEAVASVGKENCPPRSDAGLAEAGHCWAGLLVGLKMGLNCSWALKRLELGPNLGSTKIIKKHKMIKKNNSIKKINKIKIRQYKYATL